jgi:hypothetical protein
MVVLLLPLKSVCSSHARVKGPINFVVHSK